MEERIIDRERQIKVLRKKEGDDVVDELSPEAEGEYAEEEGEEIVLDFADGDDYDEDLVGLTPSQLKEELARRERVRLEAEEESRKVTEEGNASLLKGDFAAAEELFTQALMYNAENAEAGKGLWLARTENFSDDGAFYDLDNAEELSTAPEEVRSFVLEKVAKQLSVARSEMRGEEAPLREEVERKRIQRRAPFLANKKYYVLRTIICLVAFALCGVGAAVSSSFIFKTRSILPVAFTAAFGFSALVCLAVAILFFRKVIVANRLCLANETLSSTEEGARLELLQERLACLDLVLDGAAKEEENEEEEEEEENGESDGEE